MTEYGILDLVEMLNSEAAAITAQTLTMSRAMEDYATQVNVRTAALEALSTRRPQQLIARARHISNLAAGDVNALAEAFESEVPAFRDRLEKVPKLLAKLAPEMRKNEETAGQLQAAIADLYGTMSNNASSTETLLATIRDMPGMTRPLIRARDRAVVIIAELVEILRLGSQSFEEAAALLSD